MLFPTMAFGLFFLVVFFTAWGLERENGRRKAFLVLASWVFYGWWDWRFVGLLILSATLNWGIAEAVSRSERRSTRLWLVGTGVAELLDEEAVVFEDAEDDQVEGDAGPDQPEPGGAALRA